MAAFAGILLFKALSNNVISGRNSMVLGTLVALRIALVLPSAEMGSRRTEKNVTQGTLMANTTPAAPQIASFAVIVVTGYWMTLQGSNVTWDIS